MLILLPTLIQSTWRYTYVNLYIYITVQPYFRPPRTRFMSMTFDIHQDPSRDRQHLFKNLAGSIIIHVFHCYSHLVTRSITLKVLSMADAQMPTL